MHKAWRELKHKSSGTTSGGGGVLYLSLMSMTAARGGLCELCRGGIKGNDQSAGNNRPLPKTSHHTQEGGALVAH